MEVPHAAKGATRSAFSNIMDKVEGEEELSSLLASMLLGEDEEDGSWGKSQTTLSPAAMHETSLFEFTYSLVLVLVLLELLH